MGVNESLIDGQAVHLPSEIHKGLFNEWGRNHCFLNVVIQSLWHLKTFRERLLCLDYGHKHKSLPCILCEIHRLFMQYRYDPQIIIPPDDLRGAMAHIYFSQVKFQLGDMEDAEEALNEILKLLHGDQIYSCMLRDQSKYSDEIITIDNHLTELQDVACSPSCISHVCFGAQFCDIKFCKSCGAQSEPAPSSSFVYRCYASELISQRKSKSFLEAFQENDSSKFSTLLKDLTKIQEYSCADDDCKGKSVIRRWCIKAPEVFAIGITWQEETEKNEILQVLDLLSDKIDLNMAFESSSESSKSSSESILQIRGFIAYYGRHYVAFFYTFALKAWLLFDDQRVERIGAWNQVKFRCLRARFQPVLVFYERESNIQASEELAKTMVSDLVSLVKKEPKPDPSSANVENPNQNAEFLSWLCIDCKTKWMEKGSNFCPVCELDQNSNLEDFNSAFEIIANPNDPVLVNMTEEDWELWECFLCGKHWKYDRFSCLLCDSQRNQLNLNLSQSR